MQYWEIKIPEFAQGGQHSFSHPGAGHPHFIGGGRIDHAAR
jgi:hypothetical protein